LFKNEKISRIKKRRIKQ